MSAMNRQSQIQQHASRVPSLTPVPTGLFQRKCACGGTPGPSGECEECRKKTLQRKTRNSELGTRNDSFAPPIVHEVLRSRGQPLDTETRTFMEPRFGRDFSQVRVHTDARASESARTVTALAYTVGRDVVFGRDQYAPSTTEGRRLLAHELTHVVQQQDQPYTTGVALGISQPSDPTEVEATRVTEMSRSAISAN